MKKMMFFLFFLGSLTFTVLPPGDSDASGSGTLPTVIITRPPAAVVIPETRYVYFLPDFEENIFFYHGFWYRVYLDEWYKSKGYNGPWSRVQKVPDAVMKLPADFRTVSPGQERIPYRALKKNWRVWEESKFWDKKSQKARYKEREKERGKTGEETKGQPKAVLKEIPEETPPQGVIVETPTRPAEADGAAEGKGAAPDLSQEAPK